MYATQQDYAPEASAAAQDYAVVGGAAPLQSASDAQVPQLGYDDAARQAPQQEYGTQQSGGTSQYDYGAQASQPDYDTQGLDSQQDYDAQGADYLSQGTADDAFYTTAAPEASYAGGVAKDPF